MAGRIQETKETENLEEILQFQIASDERDAKQLGNSKFIADAVNREFNELASGKQAWQHHFALLTSPVESGDFVPMSMAKYICQQIAVKQIEYQLNLAIQAFGKQTEIEEEDELKLAFKPKEHEIEELKEQLQSLSQPLGNAGKELERQQKIMQLQETLDKERKSLDQAKAKKNQELKLANQVRAKKLEALEIAKKNILDQLKVFFEAFRKISATKFEKNEEKQASPSRLEEAFNNLKEIVIQFKHVLKEAYQGTHISPIDQFDPSIWLDKLIKNPIPVDLNLLAQFVQDKAAWLRQQEGEGKQEYPYQFIDPNSVYYQILYKNRNAIVLDAINREMKNLVNLQSDWDKADSVIAKKQLNDSKLERIEKNKYQENLLSNAASRIYAALPILQEGQDNLVKDQIKNYLRAKLENQPNPRFLHPFLDQLNMNKFSKYVRMLDKNQALTLLQGRPELRLKTPADQRDGLSEEKKLQRSGSEGDVLKATRVARSVRLREEREARAKQRAIEEREFKKREIASGNEFKEYWFNLKDWFAGNKGRLELNDQKNELIAPSSGNELELFKFQVLRQKKQVSENDAMQIFLREFKDKYPELQPAQSAPRPAIDAVNMPGVQDSPTTSSAVVTTALGNAHQKRFGYHKRGPSKSFQHRHTPDYQEPSSRPPLRVDPRQTIMELPITPEDAPGVVPISSEPSAESKRRQQAGRKQGKSSQPDFEESPAPEQPKVAWSVDPVPARPQANPTSTGPSAHPGPGKRQ